MTYLKLLYKTFYDLSFVKDYAKNGRGTGVALAGLLALIMIATFSSPIISKLSPVLNTDELRGHINAAFDKIPEIKVEDGELIWEDGVIETYSLDKQHHVTIDTQNDIPSMNQVSSATLYLTKSELYINNGRGKIQSVSWTDIQEAFDKNPIDLTSPEMRETVVTIVKYFMIVFVAFAVLFAFFFFWIMNGILATITRALSSKIYKNFENMDHYIIRRTATAAITPVLLLITLSQALFNIPGFWGKAFLTIIIGTLLMSKFKPLSEDKETSSDTPENAENN
ncbi:MAG: DUF1189 domain-containing protein [Lactobacillaceae bacterium]|jgi:hypothetical protein|nr:DUF1189 domain-containing protein [Lactobacillaceae bacterium]